MTYKIYGTLMAGLGVVALLLTGNETFAGSAGGPGGPPHAGGPGHRLGGAHLQHHRRNHIRTFWPPATGFFYEPSNGVPDVNVVQPSNDIHYTYTYDVPW